ncbi:hypothetical protein LTR78_000558 [Recurvomyces mirabilis]|uniref:AB hydrolase-1 domain-containing protein n=1 Tax=Recurvomyces mirabilis TaxID=574656 RepID=A0AAE1C6N6_9PEZI|nr:hypothetical protein LTR78_000558 [Recurvomyces mirabilis]KAK5162212.1 hypothetical protein LTS14_000558 [Recurvomyces mirabilis]
MDQIKLPSGDVLDIEISGAKDGFPLVWLHGTPGARTVIPSLARVCEAKRLKLITFSRAGYGSSTRRKGRKIVDEAAVVEALLKELGHEKCYVGGWSGGGPHALACAARLKGCVAVLHVAGVAPYDADGLDWMAGQGQDNIDETNASLQGEDAVRKFVEDQRKDMLTADVKDLTEIMATILPDVDREVLLKDDELGQETVDSFKEGLKHGADGWIDDDLAFITPWGFDVSEVKCPVFLYHGDADLMVPYSHGRWLVEHIPEKYLTKHLQPGQGHISIFMGQADQMTDELLSVKY